MRTVASIAGGAAVLASTLVAPAAFATETLPGSPLSIQVSDDLNCDVYYDNEEHGSYYNDTACGTFVTVFDPINPSSWETFGPASVPAGPNGTTAYTIVSQTPMSGTGTLGDPYTVTTVVELGATGLTLTQVDTYVDGDEEWDTSITIESDGGIAVDPLDIIVYRAADCYLGGSDSGRGVLVEGEAPMCVGGADSADPSRLIGFWPRTPGSNYIVDAYPSFWDLIEAGEPYPDYVMTGETDNGAGLSWNLTVPSGGSVDVQLANILSPSGVHILNPTATPDSPIANVGSTNGYTVTASNPGLVSGDLKTLTVTLPEGFSYNPGTTTGATTGEPTITTNGNGQQVLTWTGPFAALQTSSTSVHFNVTVGQDEGWWTIDVEGTSDTLAVVSALETAEIEVGEFMTLTATADSPNSKVGAMNGYTLDVPDLDFACDLRELSVTLPAGFSYVSGSSTGATTADPEIDGNVLTWDLSELMTTTDCSDPATLHFNVIVGPNEGTFTIDASALAYNTEEIIIGVLQGAPITVTNVPTPPPGPKPDPLPNTGSENPALVFGIGAGVLALGSALLLTRARRRQSL